MLVVLMKEKFVKSQHYDKKMFRLMAILNQLGTAGFVKTSDLAKEFNTNIRTVQRDIALLNGVGFPLVGEDGKYSFVEGFALRKIRVTTEEKYILTLLCRIFSGVDGPLQESARNLLNKVLVQSNKKEDADIDLPERKRIILERQMEDLSKKVQVYCQDDPHSESFEAEIERIVVQWDETVRKINLAEDAGLKIERQLDHEKPYLFCSVFVPVEYIRIPSDNLMSGDKREHFRINFIKQQPDSIWNRFRIKAEVDLFYKFFGPFIKPKRFTCFDELMKRFGFPMDRKLVNYEYSYGNEEFLISRLNIGWERKVDIPEEELKTCGRKKGLGWRAGGRLEIF